MHKFRWNTWNIGHIAEHGISTDEAEEVVANAKPPYPRPGRGESWVAWGQTMAGSYVQVVYLVDEDGTLYVIHARPLNDLEKRRLRRSRR